MNIFYMNTVYAQAVSIEDALPYNKIPGPKTLPFIGATHHFAPGGKVMINLLLFIYLFV